MNPLIMGTMLLTWCASIMAGCATTDKKASLQPKPAAVSTKRAEVVYLMMSGNQWRPAGDTVASLHSQRSPLLKSTPENKMAVPQKITMGTVKDGEGKSLGKSVLPLDFGDLMVRSLRKKLNAAEYTVISVRKLSANTKSGIDISDVTPVVEQNSGLIRLAGKCDLRIRLDLWLNGSKSVSHDYSTIVSDYSITDQSLLLTRLAQKATQNIAEEAAPNIVNDISKVSK
jgi:hypothetical protein